jgi:hypothetical protein
MAGAVGRPDPSGFVNGTNLYAYVRNMPVGYQDPTGRQLEHDFSPLTPVADATASSPALASILDNPPLPIPAASTTVNYSSAAAAGRANLRALVSMPAGTQAQHWTKEISSRNSAMPPVTMNQNMTPLQSVGRAGAPYSQGLPATTLLTDPAGGGTKYSVQGGSTFGNEHKFSDRFLIIEEEAKNLPSAYPRNADVEAGQAARWRMTGEGGPGPGVTLPTGGAATTPPPPAGATTPPPVPGGPAATPPAPASGAGGPGQNLVPNAGNVTGALMKGAGGLMKGLGNALKSIAPGAGEGLVVGEGVHIAAARLALPRVFAATVGGAAAAGPAAAGGVVGLFGGQAGEGLALAAGASRGTAVATGIVSAIVSGALVGGAVGLAAGGVGALPGAVFGLFGSKRG